jgi:hypothetical protein
LCDTITQNILGLFLNIDKIKSNVKNGLDTGQNMQYLHRVLWVLG